MVASPLVGRRRRGAQLILIAAAITGLAVRDAEARGRDQRWPRVDLLHPVARRVLLNALDIAATRLEVPDCAEILNDFTAFTTRGLSDRLVSLGTSPQRYLALLVFVDDSRHPRCLGEALAITTPGSRVVRVCGDRLKESSLDRERVVAMVIHETLHTLGLPENPPSSKDITRRVLGRCGRRP